MFHKVNSVATLSDYRLIVHFWDGMTKIYDVKPLFRKWAAFNEIEGEAFEDVKVDEGGYGISWSDKVDLSAEELWENGKKVETVFDNIVSFGDASKIWGLDESTLRKAVAHGKFMNGVDVCKYGKQWLVTTQAMEREYGGSSERC